MIGNRLFMLLLLTILFAGFSCQHHRQANVSHPGYFDPVFNHAESLRNVQPARALRYVDSAFAVSPETGAYDRYRRYHFIFFTLAGQGKMAEAEKYCDSALLLIKDRPDDTLFKNNYARVLFNKAWASMSQKKYEEAFSLCYQARQLVEKTSDSCMLSNYTQMLGGISNLQQKYLDAARYTRCAVQELKYCNDDNYDHFRLMTSKLDDIGIFYSRAGWLDSALYYFHSALTYMGQTKLKYLKIPGCARFVESYIGVVDGNMGTVYLKKHDTVAAEKLLKESLRINTQKFFDHGDAQFTALKLADLYLHKQRFTEAGEILRQLRYSLDTLPDQQKESRWYRLQFDYLAKTGKASQSWPYVQPYLRLEDSLSAIKPIPQTDVNKEYTRLQHEYNLIVLKKRNQQQQLLIIAVVALALLAALIAFLFWHFNRNISEKNILMQKALNALEQSQEDNTRMMKIVAHDLRNPIGGITSIASLMLDDEQITDDQRMMLELIKTSGQNSLELVSDLLQVHTRAEGLKKEPVDISQLLHYCVDLLRPKAKAKEQQIELTAAPLILAISREKMWRVISNLIANAIKFSPTGAMITVKLARRANNVRIDVEDHGIGIPAEMKDKIFDMFTEAKRPGTAGEQPFGLGLAISRQIVEAHNGTLRFESKPDKGTTFIIELPLEN